MGSNVKKVISIISVDSTQYENMWESQQRNETPERRVMARNGNNGHAGHVVPMIAEANPRLTSFLLISKSALKARRAVHLDKAITPFLFSFPQHVISCFELHQNT